MTGVGQMFGEAAKAATEFFATTKWDDVAKGAKEIKASIVETKDAIVSIAAILGALYASKKLKDLLGLGGPSTAAAAGGAGFFGTLMARLAALATGGVAIGVTSAVDATDAMMPEKGKQHVADQQAASDARKKANFEKYGWLRGSWENLKDSLSSTPSQPAENGPKEPASDRSAAVAGIGSRLRGQTINGTPATELGRDTRSFLERLWDKLTGKSPDPSVQASAFGEGLSGGAGLRVGSEPGGGRRVAGASAGAPGGIDPAHVRPGGAGKVASSAEQQKLAKESYDFWRSKGYSHEFAVGMVAQEDAESKFNTGARGDGGTAHGSFQWHADRRRKILAGTGIDVSTERNHRKQLEASEWEMRNNEAAARKRIEAAKTPEEAGAAGSLFYERPGLTPAAKAAEARKRAAMARSWDRRFRQGAAPTADAMNGRKPGPGEYLTYDPKTGKPSGIEKYENAVKSVVNAFIPKAAAATNGASPAWAGGFDPASMRDRFSVPAPGTNDNSRTVTLNDNRKIETKANIYGGLDSRGARTWTEDLAARVGSTDLLRNLQGAAQ